MTSSYTRHLLAQAPTDFHSKLWENAAEERRKGKEHETRMIANDARTQKIKESESLTKLFKAVATTSTKIKQFNYGREKLKAEKEAKEKAVFQFEASMDINKPWLDEAAKLKYAIKKGDATSQEALDLLLGRLRDPNSSSYNLEAADEIEKDSPRNVVWRNELWARQAVPKLTYDAYERELINNNDQEALTQLNGATEPQKAALHKKWIVESLAYLELDPTFIAATIGDELKRQSETASGTQRVNTISRVSTWDQQSFNTKLESVRNQPEGLSQFLLEDHARRKTFFKDIEGGQTAAQQANDSLFKDLNALSYDGKIPLDTLNGYLQFKFPHAAGKEGIGTPASVFFSKEQVNLLVSSARKGQSRAVQFAKQDAFAKVKRAEELKVQGQVEESNKLLTEVIGTGLVPTDRTDAVLGINITDNTEEANAAGDVTYQNYANNGFYNVTQDVIDGTKNVRLKDRLQQTFDRKKRHEDTHGNTDDSLHQDIFKVSNPKGNFISGQSITGDAENISAELDRLVAPLKLQLIEAQYSTGEFVADPTINQQVKDAKTDLWVRGGGQERGGNGRYSPDKFGGGHSNFRTSNAELIQVKLQGYENYSKSNLKSWNSTFNQENVNNKATFYDANGVFLQQAAIKDGAYLDIYDLKSAVDGGFSDKWYHFANKLGTDVETLFTATEKRILTNQPDKSTLLGLKDAPEKKGFGAIVKTQRDANRILHEGVDDMLTKLEGDRIVSDGSFISEWNTDMDVDAKARVINELKDLRFLLRTRGWSGLTDNQKQRYIASLQHHSSESTQARQARTPTPTPEPTPTPTPTPTPAPTPEVKQEQYKGVDIYGKEGQILPLTRDNDGMTRREYWINKGEPQVLFGYPEGPEGRLQFKKEAPEQAKEFNL